MPTSFCTCQCKMCRVPGGHCCAHPGCNVPIGQEPRGRACECSFARFPALAGVASLRGELAACTTDQQSRGLNIAGSSWSAPVPMTGKDPTVALPDAFSRVGHRTCLEGIAGTEARQCWTDGAAAHGGAATRRTPLRPQDRKRQCASKHVRTAAAAPSTAPMHKPGRARAFSHHRRSPRLRSPAGHRAAHDRPRAPASAGCPRSELMARARASIPRACVLSRARRRSDGDAGASAA